MTFAPISSQNSLDALKKQNEIEDLVEDLIEDKIPYSRIPRYLQKYLQSSEKENIHDTLFFYDKYCAFLLTKLSNEIEETIKNTTKELLEQVVYGAQEISTIKTFFPSLEKRLSLLEGCFSDKLFDPGKFLVDIWRRLSDEYERVRELNPHEREFLKALENHVSCLLGELDEGASSICDIPLIQKSPTVSSLMNNINSTSFHYSNASKKERHNELRSKMKIAIPENSCEFRSSFHKILEPLLNEYRKQPTIEVFDTKTLKTTKSSR